VEELPSSELAGNIVVSAAEAGLFVQMPPDLDRICLRHQRRDIQQSQKTMLEFSAEFHNAPA
jgi:hypothetical protein